MQAGNRFGFAKPEEAGLDREEALVKGFPPGPCCANHERLAENSQKTSMKLDKRIIQVILLLFVIISVVYLMVGEFRKPTSSSQQGMMGIAATEPAKVVGYYFHGNFRCVSCRRLEAVSREAVSVGFPEELKRGDLQWRAVNVEQPENKHFSSDYRLFSRSLVLVRFKDGKQVEYKTLIKAWELVNDDAALKKYVQSEVRSYLEES